jgi:hypothetical protein
MHSAKWRIGFVRYAQDRPRSGTESLARMIILFPLRRQIGFIRDVTKQLNALSSREQRNAHMISVLEIEFNPNLEIGVSRSLVERDLIEFADAVWMLLRGEKRGGTA